MRESFIQWYETERLDVHGIHTVRDMEKAYTAGVQAERERCARVAEDSKYPTNFIYAEEMDGYNAARMYIAAAIRKEAGK